MRRASWVVNRYWDFWSVIAILVLLSVGFLALSESVAVFILCLGAATFPAMMIALRVSSDKLWRLEEQWEEIPATDIQALAENHSARSRLAEKVYNMKQTRSIIIAVVCILAFFIALGDDSAEVGQILLSLVLAVVAGLFWWFRYKNPELYLVDPDEMKLADPAAVNREG